MTKGGLNITMQSFIKIILFVLLISFSSFSVGASTSEFFDEFLGDFQEELEVAKEDGKKAIVLFFELDECPFCHWMKKNVLNQDSVHKFYKKNFKIYAVDIEGDIEITDFKGKLTTEKQFSLKQFRVRATPVIAFIDLEGNLLTKFTGRVSSVKEFNLLGKYVLSKAYKTMRFSKYKRKNKK